MIVRLIIRTRDNLGTYLAITQNILKFFSRENSGVLVQFHIDVRRAVRAGAKRLG